MLDRKALKMILKVIIALIVLWFLVSRAQINFSLFTVFYQKPLSSLIIIFLLYSLIIINSWRWYRLNQAQNIDLDFRNTILPTYYGIAYSNILPGSASSDLLRLVYLIQRFPTQKSNVMLSLIFDRVTGLMGMMLLVCIIAIFEFSTIIQNHTLTLFSLFCFLACVMSLSLFFIALLLTDPIKNYFSSFLSHKWLKGLIPLFDAILNYKNSKLTVMECLFVSVLTQLVMVAAVTVIGNMMDFPFISSLNFAMAIAAAQLANLIPLTPGGLGIGEIAFANTILLYHSNLNSTATIFLAFRFICIVSYLPGCIFYLIELLILKNQVLPSREKGSII